MKHFALSVLFVTPLFSVALAQSGVSVPNQAIESGVGFGSVIAVVTSWSRNKSVGWAILHGIFSWLYVIYFVLTRKAGD